MVNVSNNEQSVSKLGFDNFSHAKTNLKKEKIYATRVTYKTCNGQNMSTDFVNFLSIFMFNSLVDKAKSYK